MFASLAREVMQDHLKSVCCEARQELEPLPGEICAQFIRCGKAGCRCQAGHLHGPYHYRIWREGGRVRKVYVKAADVEAVQAACEKHRALSRTLRDIKQARLRLTQGMFRGWRHTRRLLGAPNKQAGH